MITFMIGYTIGVIWTIVCLAICDAAKEDEEDYNDQN